MRGSMAAKLLWVELGDSSSRKSFSEDHQTLNSTCREVEQHSKKASVGIRYLSHTPGAVDAECTLLKYYFGLM